MHTKHTDNDEKHITGALKKTTSAITSTEVGITKQQRFKAIKWHGIIFGLHNANFLGLYNTNHQHI